MVSPLFTAFALIACGRAEVPPAPTQPAQAVRRDSGRRFVPRTKLTGTRAPAKRHGHAPWLADHRQAGRADLDPGRRRGQARAARGRLSEGEGRPWRHARPAGERRAAGRARRGDQALGRMLDADKVYEFTIGFGDGDRHARRRRRGRRDVGQAADAGGDRGRPAALHRRDRAGAAGLFGAEGRGQARLRSGAGRRGGRAEEPRGDRHVRSR